MISFFSYLIKFNLLSLIFYVFFNLKFRLIVFYHFEATIMLWLIFHFYQLFIKIHL